MGSGEDLNPRPLQFTIVVQRWIPLDRDSFFVTIWAVNFSVSSHNNYLTYSQISCLTFPQVVKWEVGSSETAIFSVSHCEMELQAL